MNNLSSPKLVGGIGFWIVALSSTLSQIGSGLTQVAVFSKLSEMNANSYAFAIAVFVSLVPALFASRLAEHCITKFSLAQCLVAVQFFCAFGMLLPFWGANKNAIELFYLAEFIGSINLGFMFPILHVYTNRCFSSDKMHIATKLDTLLFSSNIILGMGLGAIFYGHLGAKNYILADIGTFIISGLLFWFAGRADKAHFSNNPIKKIEEKTIYLGTYSWFQSLNPKQKSAFLLQIFICAGTVPTSALLASFGGKIPSVKIGADFVVQTSVLLLFAKATGQMLAPLLLSKSSLEKLSRSSLTAIFTCLGFNAFYFFAIVSTGPLLKLGCIVIAHLFSNVLYATSVYAVQTNFQGNEVGEAFGRQYRWFLLLSLPIPFISGAFIETFSPIFLPLVVFSFFLLISYIDRIRVSKLQGQQS